MRIETGEQLLALVEGCEAWHGRAIGGLGPDAPDGAVLWLRVLTTDTAQGLIAAEAIERGRDYTPAHGLAAIIAAACEVDIVDWTRLEYVEDDVRRLFGSAAEALLHGEATVMGSRSNDLLILAHQAGGQFSLDETGRAETAQALMERMRGRGRWIALDWLEGAPEVYVTRITEKHLAIADAGSTIEVVKGHPVNNSATRTKLLVSHVLLSGPGGAPLLTVDQAGGLPLGLARGIEVAAYQMGMGDGRIAHVATFRGGRADADGAAARGSDVVDGGEATPSAGGAGSDAG